MYYVRACLCVCLHARVCACVYVCVYCIISRRATLKPLTNLDKLLELPYTKMQSALLQESDLTARFIILKLDSGKKRVSKVLFTICVLER